VVVEVVVLVEPPPELPPPEPPLEESPVEGGLEVPPELLLESDPEQDWLSLEMGPEAPGEAPGGRPLKDSVCPLARVTVTVQVSAEAVGTAAKAKIVAAAAAAVETILRFVDPNTWINSS